MEFEWDENKAESNWRKHRIEFTMAMQVFSDPYRVVKYDAAHGNGEERWQTIGMVASAPMVLMVVYTERDSEGEVIRLISARKANKDEHRTYGKNLPRPE